GSGVAHERCSERSRRQIPQFDCQIGPPSGRESLTVRTIRQGGDFEFVSVSECLLTRACGDVPKSHRAIPSPPGGGQACFVRAERYRRDRAGVAHERAVFFSRVDVPERDRLVNRPRGEQLAISLERDAEYALSVASERVPQLPAYVPYFHGSVPGAGCEKRAIGTETDGRD